jgi:chromosome segregation protein
VPSSPQSLQLGRLKPVRLASLTLQGFKSFADRTTLEFTEPVTAIVGPNGSGKSNLIDALRWASGGGRASEFRAGDKRELIFHGSSGKRSLGFAEVQLTLEHGGRVLSVSRTLTRDGESRLKVGGRTARFLDLEDELSGSGLGRGGLAVIGQGEVSGVLMADPPKLLAYVAESVGVAKLAARREGTLASLEQAQVHLTRLEDVRGALQERVDALAHEAAEAERAAELGREQLRLRFTLSLRRVESLRQELSGLREKGALLAAQLLEGREALGDAQEARRNARDHRAEAEARYRQFMADSEARRGDARVAREQRRAADAEHAALLREEARLSAEVQSLTALTPPLPLKGSEAEAKAALSAAELEGRELQGRLNAIQEDVTARARALEAARRAEADAAQAKIRYTTERDGLSAQLAEVEAQQASLTEADVAGVLRIAEETDAAVQEQQRRLEAAQEVLAGLQQEHASAFAEAQARVQAAGRQRAAVSARRGYAQGPKSALSSGIEGVIGSVADLITVPPEYAQAITSALGRRAEHVVVDSSGVAQRVLAHVRRAGGWVTLLPLELIRGRSQSLPAALAAEGSVVAPASEVVGSDGRFSALVQQLLGGTVIVTTLPEAVALVKRHHSRPRLVTLQGDVLESYGAISGGRSQSAGLVLGAAAELKEAEATAEAAQTRATELTEALQHRQAEVKTLREVFLAAQARHQEAARQLAAAREAAAAQESLKTELARRHAQLRAALADLTPPTAAEVPEVAPLESGILEVQARQEALRLELAHVQQRGADARGALALWRERKATFDAEERRFAEARARLAEVREQLEGVAQEVTQAASTVQAARAALETAEAALPAEDDVEGARYRAAQAAEAEAEALLETLSRQQAALGGELEALNLTLARREAALELAADEHRAFPEGLAALPGSLKGLRERLAEVDAELARLGPVNHRAAQEYAAQHERLDDLTRQMGDAEGAAAELHAVLDDLDEAVRVRLVAGTEALAKGFAHYAERLFGAGAQASAELLWEDGRPAGLKLGLQPPTKQTRALSLLSVGERTMGALAFLFALMASGDTSGLPLAILDEVDAPLDEANIRRFCAFLGELSERGTQFVLITHQKATMEVASALWGVTTEGGVSRVFSIRREAVA